MIRSKPRETLPQGRRDKDQSQHDHCEAHVADQPDPGIVVPQDDEEGAQVQEDEPVAESVVDGGGHPAGTDGLAEPGEFATCPRVPRGGSGGIAGKGAVGPGSDPNHGQGTVDPTSPATGVVGMRHGGGVGSPEVGKGL